MKAERCANHSLASCSVCRLLCGGWFAAGIASRESRCGSALASDGTGDGGNGYGWMQVDRRSHQIDRSQGTLSCVWLLPDAWVH
jgi:hypothetical protein